MTLFKSRLSVKIAAVLLMASLMSGCGSLVPEMGEYYPGEPADLAKLDLINSIQCQLRDAVVKAEESLKRNDSQDVLRWFRDWTVKVTLQIMVKESTAVNPNVSLTQNLPTVAVVLGNDPAIDVSQTFALGIGAEASLEATRTELMAFTYPFGRFLAQGPVSKPCVTGLKFQIESDLKIGQFLNESVRLAEIPGVLPDTAAPYDASTYNVKFLVLGSGSINPVWKLVDVTANAGNAPLLKLLRSKTHELTITFGPPPRPASGPKVAQVSTAVDQQHFASLIGQAVAAALDRDRVP